MNFYLNAFGTFFKIGLFTIGGGYAMIPQIQRIAVEDNRWLSDEEVQQIIKIVNDFTA